jgi:hypothetical protein
MFCHFKYLRGQGLSGTVPDGRGADIVCSGVLQNLKRILPASVLSLTAGQAVAISDTFTAIGVEESLSTRSQRLWELPVWVSSRDDWRRSSQCLRERTVGKWH